MGGISPMGRRVIALNMHLTTLTAVIRELTLGGGKFIVLPQIQPLQTLQQ